MDSNSIIQTEENILYLKTQLCNEYSIFTGEIPVLRLLDFRMK